VGHSRITSTVSTSNAACELRPHHLSSSANSPKELRANADELNTLLINRCRRVEERHAANSSRHHRLLTRDSDASSATADGVRAADQGTTPNLPIALNQVKQQYPHFRHQYYPSSEPPLHSPLSLSNPLLSFPFPLFCPYPSTCHKYRVWRSGVSHSE